MKTRFKNLAGVSAVVFLVSTQAWSEELLELNKTYGLNKIVPYYQFFGKSKSEAILNQLTSGGRDRGGRIYLHPDAYRIIDRAFSRLAFEWSTGFMYGEGSWGGGYGAEVMKPHKSHKLGKALDIFIPFVEQKGPIRMQAFLPVNEKNFLGYGENFSAQGVNESNPSLLIDFTALLKLIRVLCEYGGDGLRRILIAKDLVDHIKAFHRDSDDARQIIKSGCSQKVKPLPAMRYTVDGRTLIVDHDEHIHVDFE